MFSTQTNEHMIRSSLWSQQLKDVLYSDLTGWKYVKTLTDFPDGDTFNIPSIGQAEVSNYVENTPVKYTALDTGNFQFSIDQYIHSGTYITEKMKQDSFYMNELVSTFVPKQNRAIQEHMETKILAAGPAGQTASNSNTINGGKHRFVGSGTGQIIGVKDFANALFALKKANVPQMNLVAIVDPSVEAAINQISNITNVSNNPRWEGIIETGIATDMKFIKNIFGFDVYVSNYLPSGLSETIDSVAVTNGVANQFFAAVPDLLPVIGAVRQPPKVDSEYNKDFQREEYVTTCRYGVKFFRPENLVTVITDSSKVYA